MSKKGRCANCFREDVTMVSGGQCWTCYSARRGLKGEEREAALKQVREEIWKEKGIPEAAKEKYYGAGPVAFPPADVTEQQKALSREGEQRPAIEALWEAGSNLTDNEDDMPGENEEIHLPPGAMPLKLTLYFDGPDQDLYHALQKATEANRRDSINSEVMIILEAALQDFMWKEDV